MRVLLSAAPGVGAVGLPVKAGPARGAAPRFVLAAAAVVAPVPPLARGSAPVVFPSPIAFRVACSVVCPVPPLAAGKVPAAISAAL